MEINSKRYPQNNPNIWKINNLLLNDSCLNNEIKMKIKKFFELNNNSDTVYQNPWDRESNMWRHIGRELLLQELQEHTRKAERIHRLLEGSGLLLQAPGDSPKTECSLKV